MVDLARAAGVREKEKKTEWIRRASLIRTGFDAL